MRILNPEKIECYVVDESLGQYFVRKNKLPLLMVKERKYYFAKNPESEKIMTEPLPFLYKFSKIEVKGGGKGE